MLCRNPKERKWLGRQFPLSFVIRQEKEKRKKGLTQGNILPYTPVYFVTTSTENTVFKQKKVQSKCLLGWCGCAVY